MNSIRFDQLIQRAHTSNLGLDSAGKNKSTLAYYFHLHELKALARSQRPADEATAPIGRTVQAQKPPNPPAPGAAAAIDVQVERQGHLGPGVKRPRQVDVFEYPPGSPDDQDDSDRPQRPPSSAPRVHGSVPSPEAQAERALETLATEYKLRITPRKRPLGVFEPSGEPESEAEDSGPGLAPQLANPAQPEAGGSGLGSSSAQKPVNRRSEPRAELRPEYGVCIIFACLVLVLKHFEFCNIWQIKKILILKMIMVFQCAQSLAR